MAIIKCCECNHDVSEYADKCPNCGCPVDIIKSKSNDNKNHTISFKGLRGVSEDRSYDLTSFENSINEEELSNISIMSILVNEHNIRLGDASVIEMVYEFNNYKFPDNIQETYEAMCARNRERANRNTVYCPYCRSSSVKKITTGGRLLSVGTFGLAGSKIGKQWHCNKCKSDF